VLLFVLLGVSAYCLVSLVVGVRLLLLARRTREQPEFLIGTAILTGGCLGYTLAVASMQVRDGSPELARTLYYLGMPLISLCAACLYRFWQKLYHPDDKWASWAVVGSALVLSLALVAQWATTTAGSNAAASPWYRLQLPLQAGAYAINVFASIRFHAALRRRVALGLADPIVANRVLLWALAAAAVCLQYAYTIGLVWMAPVGGQPDANPVLISALGITAASLMVLAFFPPRAYVQLVSRRAAGTH
jgi:hypothetical protein